MKKLLIGAALATLFAAPAFAQSYNPGYGTGNVMNQSEAEQTDGTAGYGANLVASPSAPSAYAYAPARHERGLRQPAD